MPSGEVVTPPPGLSKKGREAWQNHIATTSADMASGKMTEGQAKYSIYATGMEIAQRELEGSSHLGTSAEGKGFGGLPWGVGAYFQSNAYQNYRNAKDAWLNAKLRAESGATINPDEFAGMIGFTSRNRARARSKLRPRPDCASRSPRI